MRDALSDFVDKRLGGFDRRAWLKPMDSKDLMDVTSKIVHRIGLQAIRASVVPSAWVAIALVFTIQVVVPLYSTTRDASSFQTQMQDLAIAILATLFVAIPLIVFGVTKIGLIGSKLVSEYVLGSDEAIFRENLPPRSEAKAFGTAVLTGIVAMLGVILLITYLVVLVLLEPLIPASGIWDALLQYGLRGIDYMIFLSILWFFGIGVRCFLTLSICENEHLYGFAALKRASKLMKSSRVSGVVDSPVSYLFGLGVSAGFMAFIVLGTLYGFGESFWSSRSLPKSLPFRDVFELAWAIFPVYLMVVFLAPLTSLCSGILYFERRVRYSGLDIQLLAMEAERGRKKNRFTV